MVTRQNCSFISVRKKIIRLLFQKLLFRVIRTKMSRYTRGHELVLALSRLMYPRVDPVRKRRTSKPSDYAHTPVHAPCTCVYLDT